MSLFQRKKPKQGDSAEVRTKDFFDCILPGSIKFFANYYIVMGAGLTAKRRA